MNDMNVTVLTGRLTKDAELKYTNNGTAVSNFSIAVNESAKQQDGSYADKACFFDIQFWGKSAESLQQYLTKGRQITIQGRLKQDTWQDQQSGQNRSKVVITAFQIQLLSEPNSRRMEPQEGNPNPNPNQNQNYRNPPPSQVQRRPEPQQTQFTSAFGPPPQRNGAFDPALGPRGADFPGPESFNDDIPF